MSSQLWANIRYSRTPATFIFIGVMLLGFIAQQLVGDTVTYALAFYGPLFTVEPWRLITTALVHGGIMHIMFNAYSVWVLGSIIERLVGTAKFVVIVAASTVAGSLAVALLSPESIAIGASGAIFGLFAALFILNRGFGGNNVSLLVIIGINLAIGFIVPGIAWEAHVGGLIGGAIATVAVRRR